MASNLPRVLIVQVEWPMAYLLSAALDDEGMQADVVAAGPQAMPRKREFQPDVVVIGLGEAQAEALALVEAFAGEGDCGVVVVSVEDIESAQVASLDGGADDYIVSRWRCGGLRRGSVPCIAAWAAAGRPAAARASGSMCPSAA